MNYTSLDDCDTFERKSVISLRTMQDLLDYHLSRARLFALYGDHINYQINTEIVNVYRAQIARYNHDHGL